MRFYKRLMLFDRLSVVLAVIVFSHASFSQSPKMADEKPIVSNAKHVISYSIDGENVIFVLETLQDEKDPKPASNARSDSVFIYVDKNLNGKSGPGIDIGYGLRPDRITVCPFYFLSSTGTSVCGRLSSNANLEVSYKVTKNQQIRHPVYKFTIPRSEIWVDNKPVGFAFEFFRTGVGKAHYPVISDPDKDLDLSKTIQIKP